MCNGFHHLVCHFLPLFCLYKQGGCTGEGSAVSTLAKETSLCYGQPRCLFISCVVHLECLEVVHFNVKISTGSQHYSLSASSIECTVCLFMSPAKLVHILTHAACPFSLLAVMPNNSMLWRGRLEIIIWIVWWHASLAIVLCDIFGLCSCGVSF